MYALLVENHEPEEVAKITAELEADIPTLEQVSEQQRAQEAADQLAIMQMMGGAAG